MGKRNKGQVGRRTLYLAEFAEQAERLALLGLTDTELAGAFNVAETTYKHWRKRYADFGAAIQRGKIQADGRVAKALLDRALGVGRSTKAVYELDDDGERRLVQETVETLQPDVRAAEIWLRNRQPSRWGRGNGDGGNAVAIAGAVASAPTTIAGVSDEILAQMRDAGRSNNWQPERDADAIPA